METSTSKIVQILQNIGLNEKESRVYLALYSLGKASAYSVSEKSGLKKPTTYVILEELMKKGLVLKVPRAKKQHFIAKSPAELVAITEERLREFRHVLPEILALSGEDQTAIKTLYFEGEKGFKDALNYKIKELANQEVLGFAATTTDFLDETIKLYGGYHSVLKKQNTKMRAFVPDDKRLAGLRKEDAFFNREMRVLPQELYNAKTPIEIGPTFVRILMHDQRQAIVIENKNLAETLRQVFELLWQKTN